MLLNIFTLAISQLKLKSFVRITEVLHRSSSSLRWSAIVKDEITSSLKPSLTKRSSEVGYWELDEMPGGIECPYKLVKVSHKFLNF